MGSSSKRARRRQNAQESLEKEASHSKQVKGQKFDSDMEEEEHEVLFPPKTRGSMVTPPSPNRVLEVPDCGIISVTSMVKTLNDAIAAVSQDTAQIQRAYQQLHRDNLARDKAMADLTAMVKEYGSSPAATRPYHDDRGSSPITGQPSSPETIEFGPETIPIARPAADHLHRPAMEARQGYRPAAPIQRFNKSLNWPAWFRHFRAVADVHG